MNGAGLMGKGDPLPLPVPRPPLMRAGVRGRFFSRGQKTLTLTLSRSTGRGDRKEFGCGQRPPAPLAAPAAPAPFDPSAAQSLPELRASLRANFLRESREWFGLADGPWIDRATNNWFDESANYDRRWRVIDARRGGGGRVLDMACGCGTFLLYGLNHGRDVCGIEPEPWKLNYFRRKVELAGYPRSYLARLLPAVGERLPFADASFDLVTTFQTLEHVSDVGRCVSEMLRVLRPGGVLYLRAPDYNCYFEPHYRLPFLPRMNRSLARRYLSRLGRPLAGLDTLNWTTEAGLRRLLRRQHYDLAIERNKDFFIEKRRQEVEATLPPLLRRVGAARVLNEAHQLKRTLAGWAAVGRRERVVDLWVTKRGAS